MTVHNERIVWLAEQEYTADCCKDGCQCDGRECDLLFPMLRQECHCGDGFYSPDTVEQIPHEPCNGTGTAIDYTDTPMNALLGRVRELGFRYAVYRFGVSIYAPNSVIEQKCWDSDIPEGTDYERLIAALYDAVRAWRGEA